MVPGRIHHAFEKNVDPVQILSRVRVFQCQCLLFRSGISE